MLQKQRAKQRCEVLNYWLNLEFQYRTIDLNEKFLLNTLSKNLLVYESSLTVKSEWF